MSALTGNVKCEKPYPEFFQTLRKALFCPFLPYLAREDDCLLRVHRRRPMPRIALADARGPSEDWATTPGGRSSRDAAVRNQEKKAVMDDHREDLGLS